MTDQNTIPADKVRELKTKYEYDTSGDPERLLDHLLHDLDDLLPTPPQPTTGLLGRWAKHPDYGDVMCVWDKPKDGWINIYKRANNGVTGAEWYQIRFSDLTFPEQATKPEDVPAGEAWLVDVNFNNCESHSSIAAFKDSDGQWRTSDGITNIFLWLDKHVTLIAPLTPERPGKDDLLWKYAILQQDYAHLEEGCNDLQARYDVLVQKYEEAQERIKALEQPVWRIEHDHKNLRVGEYIIDCVDDGGTVEKIDETGTRRTDAGALGKPQYSPFIVFPNVGAATLEAILEAKQARDKETGE